MSDVLSEVASLLFGDGADELIHKLSPEQKKAKRDNAAENIALATNAAGAVAGPAAIYAAYRGARKNTGGMPRDAIRSGKLGPRLKRVGDTLSDPKTRKARYGAAAAGAGMVGLQIANMAGDTIAAQHFAAKKRERKQQLAKSSPGSSDVHIPTVGQLKRVAGKKAVEEGKKAAPHIKQGTLKVINETPEVGGKVAQYTKEKVKKGYWQMTPEQRQKQQAQINANSKRHPVGSIKRISNGPNQTGQWRTYTPKQPVQKTATDLTWEGEISKVDVDKRQVFGWASIVEMNGQPVVDLQGDFIDHDELEKSAYDYVIKSRKGGNMHLRDGDAPVHVSDMIESFLVTPEKKEALGLPDEMPTGWWVGYQINDDEAWNLVKSGKRTGFSIHGRGQRTPVEM